MTNDDELKKINEELMKEEKDLDEINKELKEVDEKIESEKSEQDKNENTDEEVSLSKKITPEIQENISKLEEEAQEEKDIDSEISKNKTDKENIFEKENSTDKENSTEKENSTDKENIAEKENNTNKENKEVKKIKLKINGIDIEADEGKMLMDVAKENGIKIPHFCKHDKLERTGACRLCIVEIEGRRGLPTSCCTPIVEGMVVKTHTPKVLEARRINVELLLANHDLNCTTCVKNLDCKLQRYSKELMITDIRYKGERNIYDIDDSSVSIRRDNNKCIQCGRCYQICSEVQTVHAIGKVGRGFKSRVTPAFDNGMAQSSCVNCGQCVIYCPTGALVEKNDVQGVIDALNSDKYLIAQPAPSIRATLGELFGMPAGISVTGKLVSALKEIGFKDVFDTDFAADVTIMEEGTEFIKRFSEKRDLPLITSCCPAWIKFAEQFYPEQLKHLSSCRSPQAIMASLVKTYYAEKIRKDPKDIILVDIMPCTAKKFEIARPEFTGEADFVLTTVELAKLLKQLNVDFANLPDSNFDNPLGESTGAALIFGKTGGVMEAALRTAADLMTGEDLGIEDVGFNAIRTLDKKKEIELDVKGEKIKICVVHTLGEARKLMETIKDGTCPYHFVEIMTCYGGCIAGGGQPYNPTDEIIKKRMQAIKGEDESMTIRKSHKNPSVIKLYEEYLGEPGSERAHKLLHTKYIQREFE